MGIQAICLNSKRVREQRGMVRVMLQRNNMHPTLNIPHYENPIGIVLRGFIAV